MGAFIINMKKAASATDAPEAELSQWAIMKIPEINGIPSTIHFCGLINGRGRVSSPIVELNMDGRFGVTESGRVYKLVGEPAAADDEVITALWLAYAGPIGENVTADLSKVPNASKIPRH